MDILSISAVVAATGVMVGVVFTVLELRNLVEMRQTDLVGKLHSIMGSKEWLEAWEKFIDKEMLDYDRYKKKYGFVELNTV